MSILIKGMEMPETCEDCRLSYTDQYGVTICAACDDCAYSVSCPLAPLPEKHGRLGDLDALFQVIGQDTDRWLIDDISYIETDDAISAIYTAPTIVPAEGGTDDGN